MINRASITNAANRVGLKQATAILFAAAIAALLQIWSTSALANDTLVFPTIQSVDQYAQTDLQALKAQGVTEVELYHVGDHVPPQLDALSRWYVLNGFRVHFFHINQATFNAEVENHLNQTGDTQYAILNQILYEANRADPQAAPIQAPSRHTWTAEIQARFLNMFGVPGGWSWAYYKNQERTRQDMLVEGGIAVAKTLVTSVVMYYTLEGKNAHGDSLNVWLPIITAGAFNLFFDYYQRGNSAFKAQGTDFDFATNRRSMTRKFSFAISFLHSIIVREAIMVAAHSFTGAGLFTMGMDDFRDAFYTTLKGLAAKAPIDFFIQRGQRKHGKWWAIGWMAGWGVFYSSLQVLDMFGVGQHLRTGMTVLGTVGLGYELYKSRGSIYISIQRTSARMRRAMVSLLSRNKARNCSTLLVARAAIIPPNPPSP